MSFQAGWEAARSRAVAALKEESQGYEAQYGTGGRGGMAGAVIAHAAQLVEKALTPAPERPQRSSSSSTRC